MLFAIFCELRNKILQRKKAVNMLHTGVKVQQSDTVCVCVCCDLWARSLRPTICPLLDNRYVILLVARVEVYTDTKVGGGCWAGKFCKSNMHHSSSYFTTQRLLLLCGCRAHCNALAYVLRKQ
jgi:hypothetical protein